MVSSAQMLAARQQAGSSAAVTQIMSHVPLNVQTPQHTQQQMSPTYMQQALQGQIAASGIYNAAMAHQFALTGGYPQMMNSEMLAAASAAPSPAQIMFAQQYAVAAAAAAAAVGSAQGVPHSYYNMVLPPDSNMMKPNDQAKKKGQSARRSRAVRKYPCPDCGKMFVSMSKVARHVTVHTGDRRFKCDVCHTRFTQKSALTVHMRRHQPGGKDELSVAGGVVVRDAAGESITCSTIPPAVNKIGRSKGNISDTQKIVTGQPKPEMPHASMKSDGVSVDVEPGTSLEQDTGSPKIKDEPAFGTATSGTIHDRKRSRESYDEVNSPPRADAPPSRFHDSGFDSCHDDTNTDTEDEERGQQTGGSFAAAIRAKTPSTEIMSRGADKGTSPHAPSSPPAIPAVQAPPRVDTRVLTPRASCNTENPTEAQPSVADNDDERDDVTAIVVKCVEADQATDDQTKEHKVCVFPADTTTTCH